MGGIPTYITYLWYVGIGRDGCTEERSKMTYSSSDGTRDRPHCTLRLWTRQDQVPVQGSSIGSRWGCRRWHENQPNNSMMGLLSDDRKKTMEGL